MEELTEVAGKKLAMKVKKVTTQQGKEVKDDTDIGVLEDDTILLIS
jgi:hypothetical protein